MSGGVILHVEDDPADRLILGRTFEKVAPDVRLCVAKDGEEAVAYLSGEGDYSDRSRNPFPQIVLLDLKLPRRSGFEVLEWIRKDSRLKDLPVFILSSSREVADIERAYALGANSYLVKSVDLEDMRNLARGIRDYMALIGETPRAPQARQAP